MSDTESRLNHPSTRLYASDQYLITEVAERVAAIDGDHLVVLDEPASILTDQGMVTVEMVLHYLDSGEWVDDPVLCATPGCVRGVHHNTATASDDELMDLVHEDHSSSMSLAEMYRRGRARGLISPRKEYT